MRITAVAATINSKLVFTSCLGAVRLLRLHSGQVRSRQAVMLWDDPEAGFEANR